MDAAQETELQTGLHIRVVTAPYFLATKLEAFRGRGRGDYANSHDLEDLLTVIDGRETIVQEVAGTPALRSYIAEQFRELLETPEFLDALPGYLLPDVSSQARVSILRGRIQQMAAGHR
jgi:hypothetical protein